MMDEGLFQENERLTPQAGSRHVTGLGPFELESGARLENADLAWESWGTLNESRDNAVLICHALSGDSHAAGWWSRMVGPGRAIDPAEHFILCSNVLGGCQGSTGPGTLDSDGVRLGSRFPFPSIGDMVRAQAILLDRLSIPRLRMAAGGSMGGMQVLEWAVRFPDRLDRAWVTASCGAHSPMQIGFNETARQAVLRDPKWRGGDFPADDPPAGGLAVARMMGHLTYLSPEAFEAKFSRRMQDGRGMGTGAEIDFEVESYLNYQGDKFGHRFDAGSLVVLTKAIDRFDRRDLSGAACRFLFTSYDSDWIYPTSQSRELHESALAAGCRSEFHELSLPYGHDAFLLDDQCAGALVGDFLRRD